MFKILHIMGGTDIGGIESVVYRYMSLLNKDEYKYDVASYSSKIGANGEKMVNDGANIFFIPKKSENILKYCHELRRIIKNGNYDAIHVHHGATSFTSLFIAKTCGIKKRIAHSHSTYTNMGVKYELLRLIGKVLNPLLATSVVGCGKLAGERCFGKRAMKSKKGVVLPNSINADFFSFSKEKRAVVRKELELDNQFALGLVGRLAPEKNTFFALELMKEIALRNPNVSLLLVGDGEYREGLVQTINNQKLCNVRLLGNRMDMDRIYQALDMLILPSLHEGFPVVAVEAMASGLPILLSDQITPELNFSKLVRYLPLDVKQWTNAISDLVLNPIEYDRLNGQTVVKENGFDINETVKILEKIYT